MSIFSALFGTSNNFHADAANYDDQGRQARFAQAIQGFQNRNPAQDQFAQGQAGLTSTLQQQAQGQGPSAAQTMLAQGQDQNMAQANAMAASSRGNVNPAMLQRNAMQSALQNNQQMVGQAATMRSQEQLNSQQLLAQALAQGRGQDLQAQGQNDNMAANYEQMGLSADQARLNAQMQATKMNADVAAGNAANSTGLLGGIMNGAASIGSAMIGKSDRNSKTDVKDADTSMYKFLDALKAHQYKYKDQAQDGEGAHFSVMAQELEKTPVGKAMVQESPTGKTVNYGKGFGAILAAQAALHERLKGLEGKGKK